MLLVRARRHGERNGGAWVGGGRTVHKAATATHFQHWHMHRSVGGPPRPHSTKQNCTTAHMKNFQLKMTRLGKPAGAEGAKVGGAFGGMVLRRR